MTKDTPDMPDEAVLSKALEAGFAISTEYGQGNNKLMPISDSKTLLNFASLTQASITQSRIEEQATVILELAEALEKIKAKGSKVGVAYGIANTVLTKHAKIIEESK